MRPLRRSVPAHAGTRACAWSRCAATSAAAPWRRLSFLIKDLRGRFRPAPRLAPSALEPRLEPDRPIHCPCRRSPFYGPLLGAVAATFKRPCQHLATTHARLRNQRRSVSPRPGLRSPAASSGLQQARSLPHDAKSCAHGTSRKWRIYSCLRIVSSPGSWSSADPPGYPSPSTELEDRRCAGPALRAYG
jgi:hypothetical protein